MSRGFLILDADQRSPEWFAARAGRVTGSRASDVVAKIKTGEAAARRDYRMQLVTERLTGLPQEDGYINADMQRGIDLEPAAFAAYEALTGHLARRTGFLAHTDLLAGCSVDGDIDDFTGIVECKCPKSATHYKYLRSGLLPSDHLAQIRHNLWITGAAWCDFVSYDPRFPAALQVYAVRLLREDADIPGYEREVTAFLEEVEREHQDALKLMARAA